jgi:hypothetical protein
MTLAVAWLRHVNNTEELMVASDSRLRFGMAWDCCPKLLALPRNDSIMCFAGDTMHAYPILLQIQSAVRAHPALLSRAIDLTDLRGHIIHVINEMRRNMHDPPRRARVQAAEEPDVAFILAGYSWRLRQFRIGLLRFSARVERFHFTSPPGAPAPVGAGNEGGGRNDGAGRRGRYIQFAGERADVRHARQRLHQILRDKNTLATGRLDMEPLQVLVEMIRDEGFPSIGGPPQVMKVLRHMNVLPFSVFWPDRASGRLSYLGRPLVEYERTQFLAMDPDTFEVVEPWNIPRA